MRSLAGRLFALQVLVVAVVLAGVGVAGYLQLDQLGRDATAEEMLAAAHAFAASPDVRDGLAAPSPSAVLQPLAERVRRDTGTDFVVVMTPDGIRFTHPDPAQIGQRFLGSTAAAAAGGVVTETYTGTLGPSVRAVVPVFAGGDGAGRVVALVAVGRTMTALDRDLGRQVPLVVGAVALSLLLAAAGSWLVSRWLRRITRDLGPAELVRRNTYYDAVLHAVREGMLLLDREGRIQLVNDEARRLLTLAGDATGRRVDDAGLPAALGSALATGAVREDELHLTAEHVVVVNAQPARWDGRLLGTVVTLRDHTELRALAGELAAVRGVADALSAQAHEAANRLHTVVALIELGRAADALEYASTQLSVDQELTDRVLGAIAVPELAALVVAKAAEADARGVELRLAPGCVVPAVADPRDLVTIVGNLLDNAVDAAQAAAAHAGAGPAWVELDGSCHGTTVELRVGDSGPGLRPGDEARIFGRGFSTKAAAGRGIGLALVERAVNRHGGRVTVESAGESGGPGAVFVVRLPVRAPA